MNSSIRRAKGPSAKHLSISSTRATASTPPFESPQLDQQQPNPQQTKKDFLKKYQDGAHDVVEEEDDIFGAAESGINLDDDFKTLRITGSDSDTLKMPTHDFATLDGTSGLLFDGGDFETFEQHGSGGRNRIHNLTTLELSPMDSISTSSPKSSGRAGMSMFSGGSVTGSGSMGLSAAGIRGTPNGDNSTTIGGRSSHITRKSLTDYSEGDETDVTSQMNEDDFEDLDNIFGDEESGIYDKINQQLVARQLKLQHDAKVEEMELQERYQKQLKQLQDESHANATLKLKDFNYFNQGHDKLTNQNLNLLDQLDQLDSERTVHYTYTRDDNDDFADGFDANFEKSLSNVPPRVKLQASQSMRNKASMPNLARNHVSIIKRNKSTMDVGGPKTYRGSTKLDDVEDEDEFDADFNYDNNVIRKLDRIPSFYHKTTTTKQASQDTVQNKQQLLNRYAEKSVNEKNRGKRSNMKFVGGDQQQQQINRQQYQHPHSSRIGLVKYMGQSDGDYGSSSSSATVSGNNKSMRYNAAALRWEGNEVDLLRFDSVHKPSLITLKEFKDPNAKKEVKRSATDENRNPNMVYDNENMCWINLNDDTDPVWDIPDLEVKTGSSAPVQEFRTPAMPRLKPPISIRSSMQALREDEMNRRGISHSTQRTVSSNTNGSNDNRQPSVSNDEFYISPKLLDRFSKEEEKIVKKTSNWFGNGETYDFSNTGSNASREYYWEIRKMVME